VPVSVLEVLAIENFSKNIVAFKESDLMLAYFVLIIPVQQHGQTFHHATSWISNTANGVQYGVRLRSK